MKNVINRAFMAKKKIFFMAVALVAFSAVSFAQCTYDRQTGKIIIWKPIAGLLDGDFSVSSTKKVRFSCGNLQYTKSTGKWSFMASQYSMVETLDQNVGTDYADQDVISLFGWATSGNPASGTRYQPWETYYTGASADYGPALGSYPGEWNATRSDWGQNMEAGWRTLTNSEWTYLINTREGDKASIVGSTNDVRFAMATVNSICGVILFPDGESFETSEFTIVGSLNTGSADFTTTTCTLEEWNALEAKGCVFLPAAGYRDDVTARRVGTYFYYWSSTAQNGGFATSFSKEGAYMSTDWMTDRAYGCSVRLVREVK